MNLAAYLALHALLLVALHALCIAVHQRLRGRALRILVLLPVLAGLALPAVGAFAALQLTRGLGPLAWLHVAVLGAVVAGTVVAWRVRTRLVGLLPLALLAMALFGLRALAADSLQQDARDLAAGLRAASDAILQRELPAVPPDADNAAPVYQQLGARLEAAGTDWLSLDVLDAGVRSAVAAHAELLQELREATRLPACSFAADADGLPVPIAAPLLDLARALDHEARIALADGNRMRAVEDVAAQLRLADQVLLVPTLLNLLLAEQVRTKALDTMDRVVAAGVLREEERSALPPSHVPCIDRLGSALQVEEASMLRLAMPIPESLGMPQLDLLGANSVLLQAMVDGDLTAYRALLAEVRALVVGGQEGAVQDLVERACHGRFLLPMLVPGDLGGAIASLRACDARMVALLGSRPR